MHYFIRVGRNILYQKSKEYCSQIKLKSFQKLFHLLLLITIILCFIYTYFWLKKLASLNYIYKYNIYSYQTHIKPYVVNNKYCKIPHLNPWDPSVVDLIEKRPYVSCTQGKPHLVFLIETTLSTSKHDSRRFNHTIRNYSLNINQSAKSYYQDTDKRIFCCMQYVARAKDSDDSIVLEDRKCFDDSIDLDDKEDMMTVRCYQEVAYGIWDKILNLGSRWSESTQDVLIYENLFFVLRVTEYVMKKMERQNKMKAEIETKNLLVHSSKSHEQEQDMSVLVIGIDSVSRLNLIRSMPKTKTYLDDTGWFEFEGYNKIGVNTLPNLVVMLSGSTQENFGETCNKNLKGRYDLCPFIWKDLDKKGYITSYSEDAIKMSTFNFYSNTGFLRKPTDYYFRPLLLAGERNFSKKMIDWTNFYCLGSTFAPELMLKHTTEFIKTFKNHLYFNFVWMNTFSHENLNTITRMDEKIYEFFKNLDYVALNHTIIIFVSDHGMRFGPILETKLGWYEDRLPFLYLHIPKWYENKYKKQISNLKSNRNKLITPYDLHLTIKDFTNLQNKSSCGKCDSLLKELPNDRSCADLKIPDMYCACTDFTPSKNNGLSIEIANFVVGKINRDLDELYKNYIQDGFTCATLELSSVLSFDLFNSKFSNSYNEHDNEIKDIFMIRFSVTPSNAKFEAHVKLNNDDKAQFQLKGEVSRINKYGDQSHCMKHRIARSYCYCQQL